jgi:hypothetical protein
MGLINSLRKANFSTGYQQLNLAIFDYIGSKWDCMEQYFKFIFYAILFIIYIVSQVRKMKKKAEEEKAQLPVPKKEVISKPIPTISREVADYKGKMVMKTATKRVPLLKKEILKVPVVYKPVADEELMAEAQLIENTLKARKKEEKELKGERKLLNDEHLQPYSDLAKKRPINTAHWLKEKTNLKMAFIASEIFQRKY